MTRYLPTAIFLTTALTAAGCGSQASGPAAGGAAAAPPPPEVVVVTVQRQSVTMTMDLPGRTAPYGIAEVRPQVTGIVQKRLFEEGRDVRAGAPLYQIDAAPYRATLESAHAALARSEANIVAARLMTQRYKDLLADNAVSQQEYDNAVAAQSQLEAQIAADKAAISAARINVGYTTINAPISGRIGRSTVTPGALVTANQAATLAVVQQLDPIYVDVTQSSAELLRLRRDIAEGRIRVDKGQAEVRLRLEDGTAYALPGRLQFSEVTVDERSGAVTLRAVFPNPKRELLPGMYVHAEIGAGTTDQGLLVPQQGVTRSPKGVATAMVVSKANIVELRELEVPRAVDGQWLVTKGLEAGDRVIVEGLQKVRPGAPVRVATAPAANGEAH